MSIFEKVRGTVESIYQIGKGSSAILLKNNAGELDIKNSDDSALINLNIATPTNPNHAANKGYVDLVSGGGMPKGALHGMGSYTHKTGVYYRTACYVAPGIARNDADNANITIDHESLLWVYYNGVNGFDIGLLAINTQYFIWAIGKAEDTSTGVNTSIAGLKLIDVNATFITDGVVVGDAVYNLSHPTLSRFAKVTAVDSETQLSIDFNRFDGIAGDSYVVGPRGAAVMSLSSTSIVMPTGYTEKRLVGAVKTDLYGYFRPFYTIGNGRSKQYRYEDIGANCVLSNGQALSYTDIHLSSLVPSISTVSIIGVYAYAFTVTGDMFFRRNESVHSYEGKIKLMPNHAGDYNFVVQTDNSQIIEYRVAPVSSAATVYVYGFYLDL